MIEVHYSNSESLGNQLFEYCFGRILAEELGWKLQADSIPGFPATAELVEGEDYSTLPVQELTWQEQWQPVVQDKSKRKIVVRGFFQKYSNYQPYKERIREDWLRTDLPLTFTIDADDIVVHVRRGNYVELGHALPFSFYEQILNKEKGNRRVVIFTDDPADPFFDQFQKFEPVIPEISARETFRAMLEAKTIIISQSTFSWWAAFLSKAIRVYSPKPDFGFWSAEYPEIDLAVTDESRYVYRECNRSLRESSEALIRRFRRGFVNHVIYPILLKVRELRTGR